jgi:thymidylate synthase (FAD)
MIENYNGIAYSKPHVYLLNESGIGVAELAARTCYDSFENSENDCIRDFDPDTIGKMNGSNTDIINNIENSDLLTSLAWVHHHHSIIEHSTLSFLIKGTSRGVLQEHARHRLQNISVRSTRYTMSDIINAYVASLKIEGFEERFKFFYKNIDIENILVTTEAAYNKIEVQSILDKLDFQRFHNEDFLDLCLSKENKNNFYTIQDADELILALKNGKKKRNVGDSFKHIVSDNWKVDLVVTFNLRSLKNYFDLRDSGAAWFQIQWLAEEMKKVTPIKYLKLIDKKYKEI